jgi:protein ImuB
MAPGPQVAAAPVAVVSRAGTVDAMPLDVLALFQRWGLRTLGDIARLPRADLRTRLGTLGARLHQAASGEDSDPMVPAGERLRFRERRELDWPIEGLEPLSFVLSGACEALESALERADRGAIAVTTTLHLVTKTRHERTLHLPAPMRDARVLRTLIVLDLESHPPDAGIDIVEVEVLVAPGRITQGALFTPAIPSPEDLSTLLARLGALMGTRRVGAPVVVDSHDDREFAMAAFNPHQPETAKRLRAPASGSGSRASHASDPVSHSPNPKLTLEPRAAAAAAERRDASVSFRRFRLPIAARVTVERGAPVRVQPSARGLPGGVVTSSAGPWRSSGRWWSLEGAHWDRDEWDVEIAASGIYRLTRNRASGQWEIEGMVD